MSGTGPHAIAPEQWRDWTWQMRHRVRDAEALARWVRPSEDERRAIGLLAFYYAALHLAVYMLLDQGLDLAAIWADIVKRPYITVGMLAFTVLVPLAATSNGPMIRRLGAAAWQRLHRLVYLAAAAGALHFIMLVKSWPAEPVIYAGLVVVLLLFRLGVRLQKRTKPARRRAAEPAGA